MKRLRGHKPMRVTHTWGVLPGVVPDSANRKLHLFVGLTGVEGGHSLCGSARTWQRPDTGHLTTPVCMRCRERAHLRFPLPRGMM